MHTQKTILLSLFIGCISTGCGQAPADSSKNAISAAVSGATSGDNVSTRFPCPEGCNRIKSDSSSFAYFLSHFPLKPHGTPVRYYDGSIKEQAAHAAVLDLSTGSENLQQCADAVMRIRAEYLYSRKEYSQLHFNFVSGFRCGFDQWMQGCRVQMNGNRSTWVCGRQPDAGRSSFNAWLKQVFMFAGTLSLEKELQPVAAEQVRPGDVWIQGGSPGHAVMVMDVCTDSSGNRLFLLAQSYMPAQDMHILRNYEEPDLSPWFRVPPVGGQLDTPEWTFNCDNLRRFH
jgi:hypothetical protein